MLQQYLPFTVLKPMEYLLDIHIIHKKLQQYLSFTVLKRNLALRDPITIDVDSLQQYLPFTVLKLRWNRLDFD